MIHDQCNVLSGTKGSVYRGRNVPMPHVAVSASDDDDDQPEVHGVQRKRGNVIRDSESSDGDSYEPDTKTTKRENTKMQRTQSSVVASKNDAIEHELARFPRKRTVRVDWTSEELSLLEKTFANFLLSESLPGFALIKSVQKRFPVLSKRTPAQVKARFNQLLKMSKKNKK